MNAFFLIFFSIAQFKKKKIFSHSLYLIKRQKRNTLKILLINQKKNDWSLTICIVTISLTNQASFFWAPLLLDVIHYSNFAILFHLFCVDLLLDRCNRFAFKHTKNQEAFRKFSYIYKNGKQQNRIKLSRFSFILHKKNS